MSRGRYSSILFSFLLLVSVGITSGCSQTAKKDDFGALIKSAQTARLSGHEDLAANCLKEAFELLPPKDNATRVQSVNQIYPEILALASDLRQSGRFSLSKTILDKAIEIESECTIERKQSAVAVKEETERIGDLEINLLKRADKAKELKGELKQLKHTTKHLLKQFKQGDYEAVARDGRAHLEVMRKTRGVASNAYCNARSLVVDSLVQEGNWQGAIKLLEDDVPELSKFTDADLKNADDEAVEAALFLSPLLGQIASLQVTLRKYEEAEKNAKRSYELAHTLGGKLYPTCATSLNTLATSLSARGKQKEALEAARQAIAYFARSPKEREQWLSCRILIAQIEFLLGQTKEAKRDFDSLVVEAQARPDALKAGYVLALAAVFYRVEGDEKKYDSLAEKAVRLASRQTEPKGSFVSIFETLGDGAVRLSKFSEAERHYSAALKNANSLQRETLEKKIETCKRNRSVTS